MITLKTAVKMAYNIAYNQEIGMVLSKECYELKDKWCVDIFVKAEKGEKPIPGGGYSLVIYKETGKTKKVILPSNEGFALLHEIEQSGKETDISEYIKELELE